jgi:hypothetical protein
MGPDSDRGRQGSRVNRLKALDSVRQARPEDCHQNARTPAEWHRLSPSVIPTPPPQSAVANAQICYRLEGMPLAIELAAARVLSAEQISERLDDALGAREPAMAHHGTLRAMMDWSHDLLGQEERILLWRLSAFAGGFTLELRRASQIVDNSPANPYPSQINVQNLSGNVSDVNLKPDGYSHHFPDDLGVLFMGPHGQKPC